MSGVPGMMMVVACFAPFRTFVCSTNAGRRRLPGSSLCACGSKSTSQISPRLTIGKPVSQRIFHLLIDLLVASRQRLRKKDNALGQDPRILFLDGLTHVVGSRYA